MHNEDNQYIAANNQSNEDLANAVNQPKQDASVFDQVAYNQMTLQEKFAASKASAFQKLGVQENVQAAPTVAEQVANDSYLSDRMAIHSDNSVSVKGNVLGNDKASSTLISHLRNEVYKKYGIEGAD